MKDNCITIQLSGGLGNQMFQYATALSLALDKNAQLDVDSSWFILQKATTKRDYELSIFNIGINLDKDHSENGFRSIIERVRKKLFLKPESHQLSVVHEPYFNYWSDINNGILPFKLIGYWQSEKYFAHNKDRILDVFSFPEITEEQNLTYAHSISTTTNSVSLHVRRGDYVSDSNTNAYHGCCSIEYYKSAIKILNSKFQNIHYFIFSDDPSWVKETFKLDNMTIITGNEGAQSYRDMQLMSLCKHHIIANSSFSWWGAWLGNDEGTTIAPEKWFLDPSVNTKDIYAKSWLVI